MFQSEIFGTWEGRSKTYEISKKGLEVVEFQRTQNPKLHPPIPIWDLDARVAAKQWNCLHWDLDLASRLEMKLEIPRVGEEEKGEGILRLRSG
ncbi:hypothetical protein AVEN_196404-1 [Araneus ventricosus]|uniref:Uncharacterized protein n=1 Tax=Araneus ventricosus TaxID=182803 RepID=A0A4Y2AUQ7_ARAVE|nr:hypothetical protein AVEN_196404-1 [Araneus ventricosus]